MVVFVDLDENRFSRSSLFGVGICGGTVEVDENEDLILHDSAIRDYLDTLLALDWKTDQIAPFGP